MPINKLFGETIDLTSKALDIRMAKQGLIQSNIANLETPGYKVQDLPFARVLEAVTKGEGELVRTHPRHLAVDQVKIAENFQFTTQERPVDLDEEMVKLSENQLFYQISSRIAAKKFEGLRYAIDEGGR